MLHKRGLRTTDPYEGRQTALNDAAQDSDFHEDGNTRTSLQDFLNSEDKDFVSEEVTVVAPAFYFAVNEVYTPPEEEKVRDDENDEDIFSKDRLAGLVIALDTFEIYEIAKMKLKSNL